MFKKIAISGLISIAFITVITFFGLNNVAFAGNKSDKSCHAEYCHVTVTPTPEVNPCSYIKVWNKDVVSKVKINGTVCPTPTVTPTITPVITETPSNANDSNGDGKSDGLSSNPDATKAPVCSNGDIANLPANAHVIRNGTSATVNFFITEGDSANIYWKVDGKSDWQYAAANIMPNSDKFVSYTINNLDENLGYDFGIQQKSGCGGGKLIDVVVIDGPASKLFTASYWEWSK